VVHFWGMGHAVCTFHLVSGGVASPFCSQFSDVVWGHTRWHLISGFSLTLGRPRDGRATAEYTRACVVLGISTWAALDVVISVPVGLAIFYLAARLMRVPELTLALRGVYGLFGKLPPMQRATIE